LVTLTAGVVIMSQPTNQVAAGQSEKTAPQNLKIDLSKAIEVTLPQPKAGLHPAAFKTSDGKEGWVVQRQRLRKHRARHTDLPENCQ